MKSIECYNCGSESNAFYASENDFTLVKCSSCGLLFVNPRPDDREIEDAHHWGVHKGEKELDVTGRFNPRKVSEYIKVLQDFYGEVYSGEKKKWLDIGCGHGEFLVALQKFSDNRIAAKGVEPNIKKQRSAQERGLDVSYFNTGEHTERYDGISFLNVYSHLPEPPEAIREWKRLLKPGSEILLETGDTADLDSKDHYRPFFLPDHLSFASEKIVKEILERCGFKIISVRKYPLVKLDSVSVAKEFIKILWPNKRSYLKTFTGSAKYKTDMYIRARLES